MRTQIIVVSEKIAIKLMYRQVMRKEGYTVYTASKIMDVKDYLAEDTLTLVLIDLPRFTPAWSFELTRFLKKNEDVMVFVVTTHNPEAQAFPAASKVEFYSKPLDFKKLKQGMKNAVANRSLQGKLNDIPQNIKLSSDASSWAGISQDLRKLADQIESGMSEKKESLSLSLKQASALQDIRTGFKSIEIAFNRLVKKSRVSISGQVKRSDASVQENDSDAADACGSTLGSEVSVQEPSEVPDLRKETVKVSAPVNTALQSFVPQSVTCPVCENDFNYCYPKESYIETAFYDHDKMPVFKGANPFIYDVCICPYCRYTALKCDFDFKESKIIGSLKKVLQENPIFSKLNTGYPRSLEDALELCRAAAVCCSVKNNNGYLGNIYLKASWLARMQGSWINEKDFLERTVYHYETALDKKLLNGGYAVEQEMYFLLGDILSRLGDSEKAESYFALIIKNSGKGSEEIWQMARDRLAGEKESSEIPWQKM